MPFIIPQILVQDPCCKFHDCLKILNQKYVEAKCDGCLEVDYAQEKRDLDRYIEIDKMLNIAASCGDDSIALEYSAEQETICNGHTLTPKIYGCMNDNSSSYNPHATDPCVVNGMVNGCCWSTIDAEEEGCTDPTALNYDYLALDDDGSCLYFIDGCMDATADNYDSTATVDNQSCFWTGCMEPGSCNYNELATIDDGSCCTWINCGGTGGDDYFDCERCGCVECPSSSDDIFEANGLHHCCPGGADYGLPICQNDPNTVI